MSCSPAEALQAYSEGTISLGRLAEILDTDPVSLRDLLRQNGIPLQTQDQTEIIADAKNA
jgi:predicted HTH domain antitoxin